MVIISIKNTLQQIKINFEGELKKAAQGKKTSLPFIAHQIPSSLAKEDEVFEILVIGGSIWKKAFCKKTKAGIAIVKKQTEQSVVFKTEQEFLDFINLELSDNIGILAINFAYPLNPVFENGRLDGILQRVTKEGAFHGLIGKKIAKEIEGYILKKRNKKITVSVANDTVCLLLSGLTKYKWHELAAGVDGSGVNFAFFLNKNSLVNLESGNFDKFAKTREGQIIDSQSNNPGGWLFEKETAGVYLYKHFNLIIRERGINYPQVSSTEELNTLCHKQVRHDMVRASEIARSLLKRSAQLVACQIAGIVEFKKHNMVFNMEGSLFWKGNRYKETVKQTVRQLLPKYNASFVEIKDSGILGAAKLVS